MGMITTYSDVQVRRYDPTFTTALRNAFARSMHRRFFELVKVIRKGVVDLDCFGLRRDPLSVLQMYPPEREAFAFVRSSRKIEEFMRWLRTQVENGVLTVQEYDQIGRGIEEAWTNLYISDSYKRGVIRARQEMRKAGLNVPSVDDSGGIDMILGMPIHIDRLGLLFTRVYSDLKGITDAMDAQIGRVLAQGIADGDGPRLLARKLISTINGTDMGDLGITDTLGRFIPAQRRAEMLARTEIIRAHHQAMIQEYRNWELLEIYIQGEWKTAGDDRVCEKCASLEGRVFTLDEIENMIPYHPNCRCIALPYVEELQKYRRN